MDKWDMRFLELAEHISRWSKDPSTQVGAVITHTRSKRVLSMGFNGFPAGVEDTEERLTDRGTKYEMVVHAEQNALMFAGERAEGATLYVHPLPPCARCAVLIIQSGIKRVVCDQPDFEHERWGEQARIADTMFRESGVEVDYRPPE
ncbi:MAG: dCMP deaminase family protein [Rhodospirillales bacterium]|nr:dCMP deaminase family protein [Alphaproteobacteria bacterium]MBL6948143.1 dCMP deaminase family protein [Rhodospirillales bacterium]